MPANVQHDRQTDADILKCSINSKNTPQCAQINGKRHVEVVSKMKSGFQAHSISTMHDVTDRRTERQMTGTEPIGGKK